MTIILLVGDYPWVGGPPVRAIYDILSSGELIYDPNLTSTQGWVWQCNEYDLPHHNSDSPQLTLMGGVVKDHPILLVVKVYKFLEINDIEIKKSILI